MNNGAPYAFTPEVNEPGIVLTVSLTPDQYQALQVLSSWLGVSPVEAIPQAIGIAQIVVSADKTEGERVLIQKGSQLQELTLS